MKNFQANLLIVLALALCVLCAFQWHLQTVQRNAIETQNQMLFQKNADIQGFTNSIATLNQQVIQIDARMTELKTVAATNEALALAQKAELTRWQLIGAGWTNEIAQYKTGVETLSTKLNEAYTGIKAQNTTITNLLTQRDDFVKKYNDEVKDRNDIVAKYNELAKQVEKLQAAGGDGTNK
jgi:chromosome segregation ATPase